MSPIGIYQLRLIVKKICMFLLSTLLLFSTFLKVNAVEEDSPKDITTTFHTFVEKAVLNETLYAEDENGNDITQFVIDSISEKGIDYIYDYFKNNSGTIGYIETTSIKTRAIDETKNVTNYAYCIETDTTGKFTKEWQTKLIGTIYMDGNTGLIKRASTPTLYLSFANFGASFSPYLNSVKTSSSCTSSYATFSATYHMYATLNLSIGSLPIGYDLDFKTHTHKFTSS